MVVFAWLMASQADQSTKADKSTANPQGQLAAPLPNNTCTCTDKDTSKNQTPHWYASPEWWLVIVAIPTLVLIWYQARETARAARAAQMSAEVADKSTDVAQKSLVLLNRAYLAVIEWSIPGPIHEQNEELEIRFCIINPSATAARIEGINILKPEEQWLPMGRMLTPGEKAPFAIKAKNVRSEEKVLVAGRILYTDIFHKLRTRKFAQLCWCRPGYPVFAAPDIVGLNDEEAWDKDDT